MAIHALNQLREIVLALPQTDEKPSPGGTICFFTPNKKTICYYHDSHHHGRASLWCPVYPDFKNDLLRNKPEQFFHPHTSSAGHFSDWLGIYLDTADEIPVDWNLISKILEDAFRIAAPKWLIKKLITSR